MNIIAIIPARGGSKGIELKNLADVNGKPLIYYSIKHALECELIDRVIVSTDHDEIAEVSKSFGAEVPFLRPEELAQDHVLDHPVFEHVLNYLKETEDYKADIVVHLRPTAPYRKNEWLTASIKKLIESPSADSVRSVSEVKQHPYRMFDIDEGGFLKPIMTEKHAEPYLLRRQDLPDLYYYNCVIDVSRYSTIMDQASMTGKNMLPFIMSDEDTIDIDTPIDLEILRSVYINKLT